MPYLNLDLDYFDHRKTRRLIVQLGRGAEVLPIRLWAYCGKFHCEDGKLTDYSAEEVESIVGWSGSPGKAVEALIKTGFLDQTESGYEMHGWSEHEGHISAYKAKGRAMAQSRWGKARNDAGSITSSLNAVSNADSNAHSNAARINEKNNAGSNACSNADSNAASNATSNADSNARSEPTDPTDPIRTEPTDPIKRSIDRSNKGPAVPSTPSVEPMPSPVRFEENPKGKTDVMSTFREIAGAANLPDELETLCLRVLGKTEMAKCGSRWRKRIAHEPGKLQRVLSEMSTMQKEGRAVRNPGACAEDLWKRFE